MSGIGTTDDEIQDNTVMNSVLYFFPLFSALSFCEIIYLVKRFARNDVISRNQKRDCLLFSRLLIIASLFIVFNRKNMAT